MRAGLLVRRGLTYYWRTHLAVVLGVATAVSVLAGALLVGDSVRGSLRDLVLRRLARTDRAIVSSKFFREALADDLRADPAFGQSFADVCPLVIVSGTVDEQKSGRRASRVQVYGVDDRFWRFHGVTNPPPYVAPDFSRVSEDRRASGDPRASDDRPVSDGRGAARVALLSHALASEIGADAGSTVLVRVERPSAIHIESLHGRKDDVGRTLRLTASSRLTAAELGDFSLQPQQSDVRAVFVPLRRLQQDLGVDGRVNTLAIADRPGASIAPDALSALVRRRFALEDVGLTVKILSGGELSIESPAALIDFPREKAAVRAARAAGLSTRGIFTYLVNSFRSGDRVVPYSLVTAVDLDTVDPSGRWADVVGKFWRFPGGDAGGSGAPPIVLNDWTARDLGVGAGASVTLDYYVWEEPGRLVTQTKDFRVAAGVPIAGVAADRELAPVYPGISDSPHLSDWDPPFPIDLRRIRPADEEYWNRYRTTPKAFIPIAVGQAMWFSRYGATTSIRILPAPGQLPETARDAYTSRLRAELDPLSSGLSIRDVRADGLRASHGATDFGEYFTYFSFFLVASALLLAALFFRLGVEQRAREVGLLRSVGFTTPRVRRLFATEGLALAIVGSALGLAGAVAYGGLMMVGLRTWWADAAGTTSLTLHVSAASLAAGAAGGIAAAYVCIWWTLRGLARVSERALLAGTLAGDDMIERPARSLRPAFGAVAFGVIGVGLLAATVAAGLDPAGGFFGAGASLLVACLCLVAVMLRRRPRSGLANRGWWPLSRLGFRSASHRPGRSVLAVAVIASATFILVSVGAFRRDGRVPSDRHSGVGGFPLLVDLLLPLAQDPNSSEGHEALGLTGVNLDHVAIEPFRVRPGDDASCLNLYEPGNPRILGASERFIASGRFTFARSLAEEFDRDERANPWLLLGQKLGDDVVPVIADANSMTYVLHRSLGDEIVIANGNRKWRLRFVAALADSMFQSELVISEANFIKVFPEQEGYRFLLVDAPPDRATEVGAAIERAADLGADAAPTADRLAEFHRVENTYLSTFQTLGGLGLLLGTVGLAAVLLRNVLERRRELALLSASGYRPPHIFAIVLAENVLLVGLGLAVGAGCAAVAVAPAVVERGGRLPAAAGGVFLLVAVLVAALVSSVIATRAALRTPLVEALRSE